MRTSLLSLSLLLPLAAMQVALAQTSDDRVLRFNGVSDYLATPKLLTTANTFTIETWVRPTQPHQIDPESNTGCAGVSGQKYAIYPLHGTAAWGYGHAGVGISVGTNGVSVYEHARDYMPAILVHEAELLDWTHIAVVYSNGVPSLYINGQFVKKGVRSEQTSIHPSTGKAPEPRCVYGGIGGGPYGHFKGELDNVRIWNVARSEREIKATMNQMLDATPNLLLNYEMNQTGEGSGLYVYNSKTTNAMTGMTIGSATTPIFMPRYVPEINSSDNMMVAETSSSEQLDNAMASGAALEGNIPNPFTEKTTIAYVLPAAGRATIRIFDASGREVATVVDEEKSQGRHEAIVNGSLIAESGLYFYTLEWNGVALSRSMHLIR